MSRSDGYTTKQKDMILNVIKMHTNEFTVKDIYNELDECIGLTTIYRYIDKLIDKDLVSKSIGKNNSTYYRYLEKCDNENHFYLKCEVCGNMEHIDCDCISELTEHILVNHKFTPSRDHIIINGQCKKCGEINEKK